jgi:parallel beta-helix repeat protein
MKKVFFNLFLLALLLNGLIVGAVYFGGAQASTSVPSVISQDTTWTKAGSPYTLQGAVLVNQGVTLTIEPGTTINLQGNHIQINRTLHAVGTDSNKITFNNGGVNFMTTSSNWDQAKGTGSILENAILTGNVEISGSDPKINKNTIDGSVSCSGSTCSITNNVVSGGFGTSDLYAVRDWYDYTLISKSSATASHNTFYGMCTIDSELDTFSDNVVIGKITGGGNWWGITGNSEGGTISGNTVYGCDVGIRPYYSKTERNLVLNCYWGIQDGYSVEKNTIVNNVIGLFSYSGVFHNNNIYDNQCNLRIAIENKAGVDATNNWWGTTDSQAIYDKIYDYHSDFRLHVVKYSPFLTSSNSQAPKNNFDISAYSSSNPTTSPTATSTSSPSSSYNPTPTQTSHDQTNAGNNVFANIDWMQIATVSLLAVIAVLLVVAVGSLRKRNKLLSSLAQTKSPS